MVPNCRTSGSTLLADGHHETLSRGGTRNFPGGFEHGSWWGHSKGNCRTANFEETLPWRFWRFAFSALSSCTFNSQLRNQSEWKVGEHFAFLVLLLLFSDSPFRWRERDIKRGGEREEGKARVTIKTGLKIVLLNHLIKTFHQVSAIEFNKI